MNSAIFPVGHRGKCMHIKFARLLKLLFGVAYNREILKTKDIYFTFDELEDRYRIKLSRKEEKKISINVYEFNGSPAFIIPKFIDDSIECTVSVGVDVATVGTANFVSPNGTNGFMFCGSNNYILLPTGFEFGEYYISCKHSDDSWCISLQKKIFDSEIKASIVGGSIGISLGLFSDLDYYIDGMGATRGVRCEYNNKERFLDLLKIRNDTD